MRTTIMRTGPHLLCALLIASQFLSACSLYRKPSPIVEEAISAPPQPFRVLQLCLDTPPLMAPQFFREAASAVASRIEDSITVNFGGMDVFVSYIASNSYQNDALTFVVPAFGPDRGEPQKPPSTSDYPDVHALQRYQDAMVTWQRDLATHHRQLTALRTWVASQTSKLRNLSDRYDDRGSDAFGCLAEASSHFQGMPGQHYLVIASPLVSTTLRQETASLNFAGVIVKVLWHACPGGIAAECQAHDAAWRQLFLRHGAQSVTFYDPPQSEALGFQF